MEVKKIPVNKIQLDREQPRNEFDRERLKELAASIEEVGQLQPIIVTQQAEKSSYQLIAGERRLKAIKKENSGQEIMAMIIEKGVQDVRQIQLIENLQRQDLNPLERARAIEKYRTEKELTKKEVARRLGVPRTTLTEWLNILEVKPFYRQAVLDEDSSLTLSHITLAKGLANRTGDSSKLQGLLDGVLKYHFTRQETREVVELFNKYLHLSLKEAFSAILLKRERDKLTSFDKKNKRDDEGQTADKLINSLDRIGSNLEEFMEKKGRINEENKRETLLGEFLYIYQLMEQVIPELQENSMKSLIEKIKDKHS